jgi:hypothetical protein
VNVAEVLVAGTVTDAPTVAKVVLLDSFTTTPPVAAGPLNVAVPVDETPPAAVLGLRLNEARLGGVTVTVAVFEAVPLLAVIVTVFWAATGSVLTMKPAEF